MGLISINEIMFSAAGVIGFFARPFFYAILALQFSDMGNPNLAYDVLFTFLGYWKAKHLFTDVSVLETYM